MFIKKISNCFLSFWSTMDATPTWKRLRIQSIWTRHLREMEMVGFDPANLTVTSVTVPECDLRDTCVTSAWHMVDLILQMEGVYLSWRGTDIENELCVSRNDNWYIFRLYGSVGMFKIGIVVFHDFLLLSAVFVVVSEYENIYPTYRNQQPSVATISIRGRSRRGAVIQRHPTVKGKCA